jgi:SdrD B-like domain
MTGWTNAGAGIYTYNVGTMAAGSTGSLSYSVTLATGTFLGSIVTTYGNISSTTTDANQDNNYPFAEVKIFSSTNNCNCGGSNSLKGTVAVDAQRNKVLDATDVSVAGQQLTLYKDGVLFGYATTSASGSYEFINLPNGNYNVTLTPTTGSLTNFWALPGTYYIGTTDNLLYISGVVLTGGQQSVANNFLLTYTNALQ